MVYKETRLHYMRSLPLQLAIMAVERHAQISSELQRTLLWDFGGFGFFTVCVCVKIHVCMCMRTSTLPLQHWDYKQMLPHPAFYFIGAVDQTQIFLLAR